MRIALFYSGVHQASLREPSLFQNTIITGAHLNPKTFWLIATNMALGLAVVLCCMMIAWCAVRDLRRKKQEKTEEAQVPADYLDGLKELGVAVPEASEKLDEMMEI